MFGFIITIIIYCRNNYLNKLNTKYKKIKGFKILEKIIKTKKCHETFFINSLAFFITNLTYLVIFDFLFFLFFLFAFFYPIYKFC